MKETYSPIQYHNQLVSPVLPEGLAKAIHPNLFLAFIIDYRDILAFILVYAVQPGECCRVALVIPSYTFCKERFNLRNLRALQT